MEEEEQSHGTGARLVGRFGTRPATYYHENTTDQPSQISFAVAPASCAFAMGMRTALDQLLLTGFVLAGLARLACFNVTAANLPKDSMGKASHFLGLPIPTSLSIAALMAYWTSQGWLQDKIPYGTVMQGTLLEMHPTVLLFVVHACVMVSRTLKVPKP